MNKLAKGQSGLGMIEILVALLILSIGLLGLAAMQVTSTKMTSQAQQKTQAILLAEDMIERVRANRDNAGTYDGITVDSDDSCETDFAPDASSTVAANDEDEWINSVRCLLGNGQGDVTVNTANETVDVDLSWDMRMDDDNESFIENEDEISMAGRY